MSPKTILLAAALTLSLGLSGSSQEVPKPPPAAPDAGAVKPAPPAGQPNRPDLGSRPAGVANGTLQSADDLRQVTPGIYSFVLPGVEPKEIDANRNSTLVSLFRILLMCSALCHSARPDGIRCNSVITNTICYILPK